MAKAIVRIPLDVAPALREQVVRQIHEVDHTMGLNTALRLLLTAICTWSEDRLWEELGWGRVLVQALVKGKAKDYADFQSAEWKREMSVEQVAHRLDFALKALKEYTKSLGKAK